MADTTFKQELDAAFADPTQKAAMSAALGVDRVSSRSRAIARPVLLGGKHRGMVAVSDGSELTRTYRRWHNLADSERVYNPEAIFFNGNFSGSGFVAGANPITIECVFESPTPAVPVRAYANGVAAVTVQPGDFVRFKCPVILGGATSNNGYFVRIKVSVATLGQTWPLMSQPGGGQGLFLARGEGGSTTATLEAIGSTGFSSTSSFFSPYGIVGNSSSGVKPSVVVWGSSSPAGANDTTNPANTGATIDGGFIARALNAKNIPYTNLSLGGSTLRAATVQGNRGIFARILDEIQPTHYITGFGSNDIEVPRTLEELQTNTLALLQLAQDFSLPVIATTMQPRVTGTYTTLDGQTPSANYVSIGVPFNNWLRSLSHPALIGLWDFASIVQAPGDPTRWRVDGGAWTDDGVHGIYRAHELVAATVDTSIIKL